MTELNIWRALHRLLKSQTFELNIRRRAAAKPHEFPGWACPESQVLGLASEMSCANRRKTGPICHTDHRHLSSHRTCQDLISRCFNTCRRSVTGCGFHLPGRLRQFSAALIASRLDEKCSIFLIPQTQASDISRLCSFWPCHSQLEKVL